MKDDLIMDEKKQIAKEIINAEFFVKYYNNEVEIAAAKSGWDIGLGISGGKFSYRNERISLVGREKESAYLKSFLYTEDKFSISAITGRAGVGKSKLVYSFCEKNIDKKEWFVKGMNFKSVNDALLNVILIKTKILLIIDYILIDADKIGEWLEKLARIIKGKEDITVRILLIERAHVENSREPYWYKILIKKHDLEVFCNYKNFLKLDNLNEEELKTIFKNHIKEYGNSKDIRDSEYRIEEIFAKIDQNCKVPLFILYIAQAWIDDEKRNIKKWDRESLLAYIEKKEERRIKLLFNDEDEKDEEKANKIQSLQKIFVFTMVLSKLELRTKLPSFLKRDFETIKSMTVQKGVTIKDILENIGEYNTKQVCFYSALPEIVEEFYCLNYLKFYKDNLDDGYIREFIIEAWKENPCAFAGFLCRTIEDFSDHELITLQRMLIMPYNIKESGILYADVIREYTYWNINVENYYKEVVFRFEKLISNVEKDMQKKVKEKYAVALFNMIWNSCEHISIDSNNTECWISAEVKLEELAKEGEFFQKIYGHAIEKLKMKKIYIRAKKANM